MSVAGCTVAAALAALAAGGTLPASPAPGPAASGTGTGQVVLVPAVLELEGPLARVEVEFGASRATVELALGVGERRQVVVLGSTGASSGTLAARSVEVRAPESAAGTQVDSTGGTAAAGAARIVAGGEVGAWSAVDLFRARAVPPAGGGPRRPSLLVWLVVVGAAPAIVGLRRRVGAQVVVTLVACVGVLGLEGLRTPPASGPVRLLERGLGPGAESWTRVDAWPGRATLPAVGIGALLGGGRDPRALAPGARSGAGARSSQGGWPGFRVEVISNPVESRHRSAPRCTWRPGGTGADPAEWVIEVPGGTVLVAEVLDPGFRQLVPAVNALADLEAVWLREASGAWSVRGAWALGAPLPVGGEDAAAPGDPAARIEIGEIRPPTAATGPTAPPAWLAAGLPQGVRVLVARLAPDAWSGPAGAPGAPAPAAAWLRIVDF